VTRERPVLFDSLYFYYIIKTIKCQAKKVIFLPGSKNIQIHAVLSGVFLSIQKSGENEKKSVRGKNKKCAKVKNFLKVLYIYL